MKPLKLRGYSWKQALVGVVGPTRFHSQGKGIEHHGRLHMQRTKTCRWRLALARRLCQVFLDNSSGIKKKSSRVRKTLGAVLSYMHLPSPSHGASLTSHQWRTPSVRGIASSHGRSAAIDCRCVRVLACNSSRLYSAVNWSRVVSADSVLALFSTAKSATLHLGRVNTTSSHLLSLVSTVEITVLSILTAN